MNDFNFFEYLLIMSLQIQCYKLVDRNYLLRLLSELNENCDCDNCTYCTKLKIIRSEIRKNGFGSYINHIDCCRITETQDKIIDLPKIDVSKLVSVFFFLVQKPIGCTLEKANMMLLSKEMTDKDRSLKTQLIVSSNQTMKKLAVRVWKNDGFFKDLRPNLNIEKVNVPENTLYYVNQSFLFTVKNGDIAMYNHNFILSQMLVVANQPADISSYVYKKMKLSCIAAIMIYQTDNFKM